MTENQYRCDLCRESPVELRPVCLVGRDAIPNICSDCSLTLEVAGRTDRDRDAEVFGYA